MMTWETFIRCPAPNLFPIPILAFWPGPGSQYEHCTGGEADRVRFPGRLPLRCSLEGRSRGAHHVQLGEAAAVAGK